ncbi:MAG: NTP transferase domain-containing protein [Proteobacteria bacterium]|jgi:CTP:molybdopterin cytidylyltransferase MocA|nr:NTP transferase domain-containing protein [Pseudomonadota bacterium]
MGQPKGLLDWRDTPLLRAQILAFERQQIPVVVVLGAHEEAYRAVLTSNSKVVVNQRWRQTHLSDSLRLALRTISPRRPTWVMPVDTPPVTPQCLDLLWQAGPPAVPVDPLGKRGHPALIDINIINHLCASEIPGGLRTLLGNANTVAIDNQLVSMNFNTPLDWQLVADREARS